MVRILVQVLILGVLAHCTLMCSAAHEWGRVIATEAVDQEGTVQERIEIYPFKDDQEQARIKRHGILIKHPEAQATILISHGFMCDKYYAGSLHYIFPHSKYNVMAFDFRAHGDEVDGQCCTFGRYEAYDVMAAAQFLKSHPDLLNQPIFLYGFSMGAVAALQAQARAGDLFAAMILDCPFDSSEKLMKKGLKKFKIGMLGYEFEVPGISYLEEYVFHPYVQMLVKYAFKPISTLDTKNIETNIMPVDSIEAIKKISVPCFLIHCKNDQHIPVSAIKELYDSAGSSVKWLWITNGRGHFDSIFYCPVAYSNNIRLFLDAILNKALIRESKILSDGNGVTIMNIKN